MSEQSGPFMQHMPCLQPRDLADQLSAAFPTIQHCSQTKRCLFAFELRSAAYQRRNSFKSPSELANWNQCVSISYCTLSNKNRDCPKAFWNDGFCCCKFIKELWTGAKVSNIAQEGNEEKILHNLRKNLKEKYNLYNTISTLQERKN